MIIRKLLSAVFALGLPLSVTAGAISDPKQDPFLALVFSPGNLLIIPEGTTATWSYSIVLQKSLPPGAGITITDIAVGLGAFPEPDGTLEDRLVKGALNPTCKGFVFTGGAGDKCTFGLPLTAKDFSDENADADDENDFATTKVTVEVIANDGERLKNSMDGIATDCAPPGKFAPAGNTCPIPASTPEPATLSLFAAGGLLIAAGSCRKRKRAPQ